MKLLLKHGADTDLVDDRCENALVKAVLGLHPLVVRVLLKTERCMSDIKRYELSELLCVMLEELHANDASADREEKVCRSSVKSLLTFAHNRKSCCLCVL